MSSRCTALSVGTLIRQAFLTCGCYDQNIFCCCRPTDMEATLPQLRPTGTAITTVLFLQQIRILKCQQVPTEQSMVLLLRATACLTPCSPLTVRASHHQSWTRYNNVYSTAYICCVEASSFGCNTAFWRIAGRMEGACCDLSPPLQPPHSTASAGHLLTGCFGHQPAHYP